MTYETIMTAVAKTGLSVVGGFHPAHEPDLTCFQTLLLLGPGGPEMWQAFSAAPEARDSKPDPLERWSTRVIGTIARDFGATAFYPFGGPPYRPFIRWAALGEAASPSPVVMQVTAGRGLWASYRGALAFAERLDLPDRDEKSPCGACPRPCLSACPVDAFANGGYDVPKCIAHLRTEAGQTCMNGCLVRHSCPAGARLRLPEPQRQFHMQAFLRAHD